MTKTKRVSKRVDFSGSELGRFSFNTDKPPPGSIFWQLWEKNETIANQALDTQYIQGICHGTLDPNDYGAYNIQDVAYCTNGLNDYRTIEADAKNDHLLQIRAFAAARVSSYKSYVKALLTQWHLSSDANITPGEAAQTYIEFESGIANDWPEIYGIAVMIPCDYLWSWLANRLKQKEKNPDQNIYQFWITENLSPHGGYRLGNFIDNYFKHHPSEYNFDCLNYVYSSAMTCELNFFRSATGQSLLPMPLPPEKIPGKK